MLNLPRKTLVLIGVLATLAILLLIIAIKVGNSPQTIPKLVGTTPTPAVEKSATVAFSPSFIDLSSGTTSAVTVDIVATSGKQSLTGVQVNLVYDPKVVTNIQLLPPDPVTSLFGPIGTYANLFTDNKTGSGALTFAIAINPTQNPVTGTGSVGRLSFSVLRGADAQTAITFGSKTAVTTAGIQQSILLSSTPLTVKIQ